MGSWKHSKKQLKGQITTLLVLIVNIENKPPYLHPTQEELQYKCQDNKFRQPQWLVHREKMFDP